MYEKWVWPHVAFTEESFCEMIRFHVGYAMCYCSTAAEYFCEACCECMCKL